MKVEITEKSFDEIVTLAYKAGRAYYENTPIVNKMYHEKIQQLKSDLFELDPKRMPAPG